MALFIEFLTAQWMLVGGISVCFILLLQHESRKGGAQLSPQQLINLVNHENAIVVDLRDPADFRKGHIVDALNMPHTKLNDSWAELDAHKSKPLVLVCKMGQHSGLAAKTLLAHGFEKVTRLRGGILEWQNSQLPLVK